MNGDAQIAALKLIVAGADFLTQHSATEENKRIGAVNDLIAQANRIVEIRNAGPKAKVYTDDGSVIFDMDMQDTTPQNIPAFFLTNTGTLVDIAVVYVGPAVT